MSIFDYISENNIGKVLGLISSGTDVNQTSNITGTTPLFYASLHGYKEICELLISFGANVNQSEINNGESPLWIASCYGKLEICEILISSGANVNQVDISYGRTSLWIASGRGHKEICQLLVSSGANLNQSTTDEKTPLHIASWSRYEEITQLLNNEINRRKSVSVLLLFERLFNSESLFHEDNLPLDMFKLIWNELYLSFD